MDQSQIARDWIGGRFDILCTTTCALVGNENPKCGLIVIVGNLYNIAQLVQALNRLRPGQRGKFAEVFIVAKTVSGRYLKEMVQAEENAIYQLKETGDLSGVIEVQENQITSWRKVFGFKELYSFVHCRKVFECRVVRLCDLMGFKGKEKCNRCCFCSSGEDTATTPKTNVFDPLLSAATKTKEEEMELSKLKQRARMVFDTLGKCCPACNRQDCNGENHYTNGGNGQCKPTFCEKQRWRCFRCGFVTSSAKTTIHNSPNCPILVPKTSGRICLTCYDRFDRTKFVAGTTHSRGMCPLKLRLRALLQNYWKGDDFRTCVLTMDSSEFNYYQTICNAGRRLGILSSNTVISKVRKEPLTQIENGAINSILAKKVKLSNDLCLRGKM
jgi:hypothetical protein